MYQDALLRRQKINRKVYFSGIPTGSVLEGKNNSLVHSTNQARRESTSKGDLTNGIIPQEKEFKQKSEKVYIPRLQDDKRFLSNATTRESCIESESSRKSDSFRIGDVYSPQSIDISEINPQSVYHSIRTVESNNRTREDVIKAALLHGVWEGSETGGSTNPNSPFLSSQATTPSTDSSLHAQLLANDSQLYESTVQSPTKEDAVISRSTLLNHALQNGIWELDEDGLSVEDSPLPSTSSSVASAPASPASTVSSTDTKKRKKNVNIKVDKENVQPNVGKAMAIPKVPSKRSNELSKFVLHEGSLRRLVNSTAQLQEDASWIKGKYTLLNTGILTYEETNGETTSIDMKVSNVKGIRGADQTHLIIIRDTRSENGMFENITLACASADDQVEWVACLIGQTDQLSVQAKRQLSLESAKFLSAPL